MLDKAKTIQYIVNKVKNDTNINLAGLNDILISFSLERFIEDITGQSLRVVGGKLRTNCPFPSHKDTNASFFIYKNSDDKPETFYCFGCSNSNGGTILNFIEDYYGLSKKEAVEYLKSIAHKYII